MKCHSCCGEKCSEQCRESFPALRWCPPAEMDRAVRATSPTTILIQPDTGTNTALCVVALFETGFCKSKFQSSRAELLPEEAFNAKLKTAAKSTLSSVCVKDFTLWEVRAA